MAVQTELTGELFAALLAAVVPTAGSVHHYVPDQVAARLECSGAAAAPVRVFVGVRPSVDVEGVSAAKGFAAHVADVRPSGGVRQKMALEVGATVEKFAAHLKWTAI